MWCGKYIQTDIDNLSTISKRFADSWALKTLPAEALHTYLFAETQIQCIHFFGTAAWEILHFQTFRTGEVSSDQSHILPRIFAGLSVESTAAKASRHAIPSLFIIVGSSSWIFDSTKIRERTAGFWVIGIFLWRPPTYLRKIIDLHFHFLHLILETEKSLLDYLFFYF